MRCGCRDVGEGLVSECADGGVDIGDNGPERAVLGGKEARIQAAIEHGDGGVKVAAMVDEDDLAGVAIEFDTTDDEEEFFECSGSAGKGDEAVGFGEHHGEAGFHGIDEAQV